MVQMGQVHSLLDTRPSGSPVSDASDIMEYLLAVGAAVPIPKAFVSSALKDRMSIPGFKNIASSAGFNIPREVRHSWSMKYSELASRYHLLHNVPAPPFLSSAHRSLLL